jgi:uncharacterized protein YpiB (UPF0302 family)
MVKRHQDMAQRAKARKAFLAAEKAKKENKERTMAFVSAIKDSANEVFTMSDLLQQIDAALAQMV